MPMTRATLPLGLLAGSLGLAPAIIRGASTSVHIGSREFQLGSPFDVTVEFPGRPPLGDPQIAAWVREFIVNYPEKRDYWEIVDLGLARRLRGAFPQATPFAVLFTIEPDLCYPVERVSRVDIDGEGGEEASFRFNFAAAFANRLHRLEVGYRYAPGCLAADIPDYRYIQQELLVYGSVHDLGLADGRRSAAAYLLARFPVLPELYVSLDGEQGTKMAAADRPAGVGPLAAGGDCRAGRSRPGEELVFAPAEYCGIPPPPGSRNRRYVTPPLATGAGGEPYEAEMRAVAAGLADGILLPAEFAARAAGLGLGPAAEAGREWHGAFLTNRMGRSAPSAPVICGAPQGWFPTCRPAELAGLALPGAPCAAIVPVCLAQRMAQLDDGIRWTPETAGRRLLLFTRSDGSWGAHARPAPATAAGSSQAGRPAL